MGRNDSDTDSDGFGRMGRNDSDTDSDGLGQRDCQRAVAGRRRAEGTEQGREIGMEERGTGKRRKPWNGSEPAHRQGLTAGHRRRRTPRDTHRREPPSLRTIALLLATGGKMPQMIAIIFAPSIRVEKLLVLVHVARQPQAHSSVIFDPS